MRAYIYESDNKGMGLRGERWGEAMWNVSLSGPLCHRPPLQYTTTSLRAVHQDMAVELY